MSERGRVFGNNLKLLLKERGVPEEAFAKQIGHTVYELQEIMDARVILDHQTRECIAKQLGVDEAVMYEQRPEASYIAAGCMECRGSFEHSDNKKLILDLFDIYCDIQEVLAMED